MLLRITGYEHADPTIVFIATACSMKISAAVPWRLRRYRAEGWRQRRMGKAKPRGNGNEPGAERPGASGGCAIGGGRRCRERRGCGGRTGSASRRHGMDRAAPGAISPCDGVSRLALAVSSPGGVAARRYLRRGSPAALQRIGNMAAAGCSPHIYRTHASAVCCLVERQRGVARRRNSGGIGGSGGMASRKQKKRGAAACRSALCSLPQIDMFLIPPQAAGAILMTQPGGKFCC